MDWIIEKSENGTWKTIRKGMGVIHWYVENIERGTVQE